MPEATVIPELAPRYPHPPGVLSGLGVVVAYFVLQFAIGLVVGVAVTVVAVAVAAYAVSTATRHLAFGGDALKQIALQPQLQLATVVITLIVEAIVMLWFIHRYWRPLWRVARPPGFGFTASRNGWYFLLAVAIGLTAAIPGGMLANWLGGHHAPKQDVSQWAGSVSVWYRIPLAFVVVCVAPLVEETIFRGVLLSGLMRRMHVALAVLLSALIFGAVHLPDFKFAWYPIPTLVMLGLLLAWLRLRSQSIWPSITAHATNNLVAAVAWFVVAAHPHP